MESLKNSFYEELKKQSKIQDLEHLKHKYFSLLDEKAQQDKKQKSYVNSLKKEIKKAIKIKKDKLPPEIKKQSHVHTKERVGRQHPLIKLQREVEDIFLSMGFELLDGPHMEDEYYNFTALNIAKDHPARDMQDTFWFSESKLLRTHTSSVQIRALESKKPPFRFIAPGKVFRCERTDATHESCFHQIEGMIVGENLNIANLIFLMKHLLKEIFKEEMEIRLRPGYFPFVEPGFELDIMYKGKWLELLPCGIVHPKVLEGKVDEKYTGLAFGLGLDRLLMVREGLNDIRDIHRNSFLEEK